MMTTKEMYDERAREVATQCYTISKHCKDYLGLGRDHGDQVGQEDYEEVDRLSCELEEIIDEYEIK